MTCNAVSFRLHIILSIELVLVDVTSIESSQPDYHACLPCEQLFSRLQFQPVSDLIQLALPIYDWMMLLSMKRVHLDGIVCKANIPLQQHQPNTVLNS